MFKHDKQVERLRDIEFFAECTMRDLKTIASLGDHVAVHAGDILVGSHRSLLLVTSGEARRNGHALHPGDAVGPLAMLGGSSKEARAEMSTDGTVLVVGRREFETLVRRVPGFAFAIAKDAARRVAAP